MRNLPGTYALVLESTDEQWVEVGKLGRLQVRPGFYVYVGSAFGPGGLKARTAHHARISVRPHWHIDYLRPICHLKEIWYSYESKRYEHRWAGALSRFERATIPLAGFGASDCSCPSHLFRFSRKPSERLLRDRWHCPYKIYSKQPDLINLDSFPVAPYRRIEKSM
jgi:Uri superfamily endonuclease